jgi:hypothetical protein
LSLYPDPLYSIQDYGKIQGQDPCDPATILNKPDLKVNVETTGVSTYSHLVSPLVLKPHRKPFGSAQDERMGHHSNKRSYVTLSGVEG